MSAPCEVKSDVKLPLRLEEDPEEGQTSYSIPDLLKAKRDGKELSRRQISLLVEAISNRTLEDAQLGAFLMSVYLKGLTKEETAALTFAMKNSGSVLKWPSSWTVVDKHSTGGVGDKVSIALAPALASKGLKVPMISGRGLGHTGGTLDKLESIPGLKVCLSEKEMMQALDTVGCCIVGQTEKLVPADKRMYAIRDVTATVSSIPLIVSSIISKKACESLHSLVLDVKFGNGSFMTTQFEAESLAEALVSAGDSVGMNTSALVTSMQNPIGKKIGNALEIEEALSCMRGDGPKDLRELVVCLGAELLTSTGHSPTMEEGQNEIAKALDDGSALKTFSRMIEAQGVSKEVCDQLCGPTYDGTSLPHSKHNTKLVSHESGTIVGINAMSVAEVSLGVGAGRTSSGDSINHGVGIVLLKVKGDQVNKGDPWAEIRHDTPLGKNLLQKAEAALSVATAPSDQNLTNGNDSLIVRRISRKKLIARTSSTF